MNVDRDNPYVLLGVPFGVSSDEAEAAFARQARGLRHKPDGAERLRRLTWALNQITEILKDPHLALHVYRVPADPAAFEAHGSGVLDPPPEQRGRGHGDVDEALAQILDHVRAEAIAVMDTQLAASAALPDR